MTHLHVIRTYLDIWNSIVAFNQAPTTKNQSQQSKILQTIVQAAPYLYPTLLSTQTEETNTHAVIQPSNLIPTA